MTRSLSTRWFCPHRFPRCRRSCGRTCKTGGSTSFLRFEDCRWRCGRNCRSCSATRRWTSPSQARRFRPRARRPIPACHLVGSSRRMHVRGLPGLLTNGAAASPPGASRSSTGHRTPRNGMGGRRAGHVDDHRRCPRRRSLREDHTFRRRLVITPESGCRRVPPALRGASPAPLLWRPPYQPCPVRRSSCPSRRRRASPAVEGR
jgi:hypothetical protein